MRDDPSKSSRGAEQARHHRDNSSYVGFLDDRNPSAFDWGMFGQISKT